MHIRIGTRKSQLASWQANWVAAELQRLGATVELVPITTTGDVVSGSLSQGGGQGLFTKEIQVALLDGRCDLAVHSLKDLPTKPTEGLALGAVPPRAPAQDAILSRHNLGLIELPSQSKIGTGSPRRIAQLKLKRPDLIPVEIRGNLDTRIRKLEDGEYDAIILAEAGLSRLGWHHRIAERLPFETMLPAAGQGALGLEIRSEDKQLLRFLEPINDPNTWAAVTAERALLRELDAGCLAPIGAHATVHENHLFLEAIVAHLDGSRSIRTAVTGVVTDPRHVGTIAADQLRRGGVAHFQDLAG